MKRLWEKPEITILVDRKTDEVIYLACKSGGNGSSPSGTNASVCYSNPSKKTCGTLCSN